MTEEAQDTAGKDKPYRVPVPPSWRQVVSTAAGFLGVLLACIYGSWMLEVPPTVAVGGFYFILGGALLVPLQAQSVRWGFQFAEEAVGLEGVVTKLLCTCRLSD